MTMLLETIAALGSGTYTVTRGAAPTVVRGVATPGTTSTFTIDAGMQPIERGNTSTPEAARGVDSYLCYTATQLRTDEGAGVADLVDLDGAAYEVAAVKHWVGLDEEFWIATISKRSQR